MAELLPLKVYLFTLSSYNMLPKHGLKCMRDKISTSCCCYHSYIDGLHEAQRKEPLAAPPGAQSVESLTVCFKRSFTCPMPVQYLSM